MAPFYYKAYRSIYSVVRFGARFAVFGITGLALLGALVVMLTQLESFRSWAIGKGLDALNQELMGRVTVGDVDGNFITGLNLYDVRLFADSTTVLHAPYVELNYQLEPIFKDNVIGAHATIHEPVIRLVRNRTDSIWNFERITKPATDSIKTPFNWTIDIAGLEIVDAKVYVHDLTAPRVVDTNRYVDFRWLELERMNLSMQANIAPTSQSIWIQNLSFDMPQPDIRLVELAGSISIDTTGLTVRDMTIETTRSLIAFNGHVDSLNVLGAGGAADGWQKHPLRLDLTAERISTLELRRFVPDVDFLAGSPSLDLSIEGLYEDLKVRRLDLGLTHSNISIAGRVVNLDNPDSLWIDARMNPSNLTYRDVPLFVPGLGIPDLTYLGDVDVRSATYKGFVNHFTSTIDATTAIGAARGGARLDLRGPMMAYSADLALIDANIEPIVGDKSLSSNFTGRAVVTGRGTTLQELDSRFRLESQASSIAGRSYRKLYADGRISGGGLIDADTVLVAWGEGPTTSDGGATNDLTRLESLLQPGNENALAAQVSLDPADRQLFAGSASLLTAGGTLDLNREKYRVFVTGRNFDPSRLTLDDSQKSTLTFTADADGAGFDPDAISGNGHINVTDALVNGKRIPAFKAGVTLLQDGSDNRTLSLRSDIADADVTGRWRFESIIPAITEGIDGIASYIGRKAQYRGELGSGNRALVPINAEYSLTLKNLAPLQLLMPGTTIVADGTVDGAISGTRQTINISVNADLKTFRYSSGATSLSLPSTRATIDLRNITPGHIEDLTTAEISIESDSLVRYGDLTFTVPDIDVSLANGQFAFHGATAINNSITLAVDGGIDVRDPDGYRVLLDTLLIGVPNGPQFHNVSPVRALISGEEIRVDSMVMQRGRWETVSITGALIGDRFRDVVVEIQRGSLRAIRRYAGNVSGLESLGGNIREGIVRLNGTFEDPTIDVSMEIDSLSFAGNVIGDFRTDLYYMDQNLTGQLTILDVLRSVSDTSRANASVVIRKLPVDLALASRKERLLSGRPVEIEAETVDLPIAFASAFVPGVRFLDGMADLKFAVNGTYPNLEYNGNGMIRRGRMLIEGNNVTYFMSAGFKLEDERLTVERMSVRNDPRDLVNSSAMIDGHIDFDGLEMTNMNFNADIERLLILSDATQAVNSTVYGDLVIATGERNLNFSGPLSGPLLKGDVVVLNGNLTLPMNESRLGQSGVVKYVEYQDWIALTERPFGPASPFDEDPASLVDSSALDSIHSGSLVAASRGLQEIIDSVKGRSTGSEASIVDLMQLDLRIFINGRMFVRVDFSPIEQLRAEIGDGGSPIQISRGKDRKLNIVGTMVLMEGSDFTFIKKFEADGYITFRENIETPEFDITARHTNRRLLDEGGSEEYEVIARISGNMTLPKLTLDYTIDNRPAGDASEDQKQRNAIALLLFGRTSEELAGSGVGGHASTFIGSAVGSGSSSLVSSILNEAFTTTGFIRSFDIDLGGDPSDFSQARINSVFQFGKIIVRYGGQVSSPNDGVIAVELPLALATDIAVLRNLTIQLQREYQSISSAQRLGTGTTDTETIRLRFQFRYAW